MLGSARSSEYSDGHDGPCLHEIYSLEGEERLSLNKQMTYSDLITDVLTDKV